MTVTEDTSVYLALRSDRMCCVVAPHVGGAIVSLTLDGNNILRPAPAGTSDILATACFPLVPFANRIDHGTFRIGHETVHLPADPCATPHAHHGHGWRRSWQVDDRSDTTLGLSFEREADNWPWRYRAEQLICISDTDLTIDLTLHNLQQSAAMPAGAGIHPYFPRHIDSQLEADARRYWRNDPSGLACAMAPSAHFRDGSPVSIAAVEGADNFFETDGQHVIVTGGGHRVSVEGSEAGFHLYAPVGADYFCVEPVSHAPNSFGRGEFRKSDFIDPGRSRRWRLRLGIS